jgi:hypothetical protein
MTSATPLAAEVLEFRYVDTTDIPDPVLFNDGLAWSRVYEYPLVLRRLKELARGRGMKVHNTSWGFQGIHVVFKQVLDYAYDTIHSDIRPSNLSHTMTYSICDAEPALDCVFDAVLNVSTMEEVPFPPDRIVTNLLRQVKPCGQLICTFDVPGVDLPCLERVLGRKISDADSRLTGTNSIVPNPAYGGLSCGLMVLRRI